jgi:hypothetical protein
MTGRITTVAFHADTLFAIERDDGVFVALKPICDALGVEWRKQRERISRDTILSEGSTIMGLPSAGGMQDTTCLRLDLVNGWLFGIDEDRVRPEAKDRVLEYKRECYATLFRHFYRPSPQVLLEPRENETISLRMVTEARQTFGPAAAAQLWFKLGLPVVPAMTRETRQGELPEPVGQAVAA